MGGPFINVAQTLEQLPWSSFQRKVVLMCALVLFAEGYDLIALSYVAPVLSSDWGLARGALGSVFGAGLFGLLLGSLCIAPLADRFGRRGIMIGSIFFFGLLTLATPLAHSLHVLLVMRLLTGVGLGGAMATAVTTAADFSPNARRAGSVMFAFTVFPVGSAVGGFTAAWLLKMFGWQSVFVFGGVLTLLIAVILMVYLPESIRFLASRRPTDPRIGSIIARISGSAAPGLDTQYITGEDSDHSVSVRRLFQGRFALVTPLVWIVNFMSLLDVYLLTSWLPTLINERGVAPQLSVIIGALLPIGGILGSLFLIWLLRWVGSFWLLPLCYMIAGCTIVSIPMVGRSVPLIMVTIIGAGIAVIGSNTCNSGLIAVLYPSAIRATAIGYANGIGRLGSISGPMIAGVMLSVGADTYAIYLFGAFCALCAAIALVGVLGCLAMRRTLIPAAET